MKKLDEIQEYFQRDLKKDLEKLEQERLDLLARYSYKTYGRTMGAMGILCIVAIIISIIYKGTPLQWVTMFIPFTGLVGIVYPIVIAIMRQNRFPALSKTFRNTILPKLIAFVNPDLKCTPEKGIDRRDIEDTLLFHQNYGVVTENLVEGKIGQVPLRFCDVWFQQRNNTSNLNYGNYVRLFFQVELKNKLKGNTIVRPDTLNVTGLGSIGGKVGEVLGAVTESLERMSLDKVPMQDPDFEKYFSVFATSSTEAQKILNPAMMKKLMELRLNVNEPVSISFTGNHMNFSLAVPSMATSGEVKGFMNFEPFKMYFGYLLIVLKSLEEMNIENVG